MGPDEQTQYELRGKIRVPSGQTTVWGGQLAIWWRTGLSCSGSISTDVTPNVAGPVDTWIEVSTGSVAPPTGARSARISLSVNQNAPGGSLSILFDDLLFHEPLFFADGFESGDTALWSNTVP